MTKENRTPIYRTTIYRVNRYTIATIFKPINVGLRCTLFNPLSHPSLLKSCQYRIPHLRFCGLGESRYPDPSLNRRTLFLWATSPNLPHFTGLMDRLPYGSGGFLLFQDSVVPQRIELYPQDFQSCVQTTYTREPIMIMLEYPSRSNLNCLIVVLRGLGRGCRILEPILDCRHPRDRENHYHSGK